MIFPAISLHSQLSRTLCLPCSRYQIIVVKDSVNQQSINPQSIPDSEIKSYSESRDDPDAAYLAFEFDGSEFDKYKDFVLGNGAVFERREGKSRRRREQRSTVQYTNGKLTPETKYKYFGKAFTNGVIIRSCFLVVCR